MLADLALTPSIIALIWLVKIEPLNHCELAGYLCSTVHLSQMHLSDMGACSTPPDRACIVHCRMKDVLMKHTTRCGGLATRGPCMPSLRGSFFSNLIHVV